MPHILELPLSVEFHISVRLQSKHLRSNQSLTREQQLEEENRLLRIEVEYLRKLSTDELEL